MIGSTFRPINETRFQGSSSGTQCTITTGTGIACTSDERLKTNITDLSTALLDNLIKVRTVHYNLIGDLTNRNQVGFLAQDLETYFPELVDTDATGYKSVYYAQMTPILTEAIRELDLKITPLIDLTTANNSFVGQLIAWLGSMTNGLTQIHVDQKICIGATCMTESDLQSFKSWQASQNSGSSSQLPTPTPVVNTPAVVTPDPTPTIPDSTPTPTPVVTPDPTVVVPPVTPDPAPVQTTGDTSADPTPSSATQ